MGCLTFILSTLNFLSSIAGLFMIISGSMAVGTGSQAISTVRIEAIVVVIIGVLLLLTTFTGGCAIGLSYKKLLIAYTVSLSAIALAQLSLGIVIVQQATGTDQLFWNGVDSKLGVPLFVQLFIYVGIELILIICAIIRILKIRKADRITKQMMLRVTDMSRPMHAADEELGSDEVPTPVTPSTPYGEIPRSLQRGDSVDKVSTDPGSEKEDGKKVKEKEEEKDERRWSSVSLESRKNSKQEPSLSKVMTKLEQVVEKEKEKNEEFAEKLGTADGDMTYAEAVKDNLE